MSQQYFTKLKSLSVAATHSGCRVDKQHASLNTHENICETTSADVQTHGGAADSTQ